MQAKAQIVKSILLSKIKKQPYKLNFAITSACNSRCRTCNVGRNYLNNPAVIEQDLSLIGIGLIFKNLPPTLTWLSLSGGEPFLRADLVEICQAATENIRSLCLISIPSNGLLQDTVLKKTKQILALPLKNLFLNFSLDGPEEIHDKIRGIPGAYKKTWSTYEKILALSRKEPRLAVNIETTISRYNFDYLEQFFKKLVADGHKITVTIAHTGFLYKNTRDDKQFTKLNHDEEKLKKIIKIVRNSLIPTSPNDLIERIYLGGILRYYRNFRKQPVPCIALKSSIALDSQGNILPCFMWGKTLGNIRDYNYNLQEFMKKKQGVIQEVRKLIKAEKCPNCWTPCEAYQSIINGLFSGQVTNLINFR